MSENLPVRRARIYTALMVAVAVVMWLIWLFSPQRSTNSIVAPILLTLAALASAYRNRHALRRR